MITPISDTATMNITTYLRWIVTNYWQHLLGGELAPRLNRDFVGARSREGRSCGGAWHAEFNGGKKERRSLLIKPGAKGNENILTTWARRTFSSLSSVCSIVELPEPCPWWSDDICEIIFSYTVTELPCTTRALIIFKVKPMQPTIKISSGVCTSSTCTKRSMDWRKIDSASATRKTPLKKAPKKLLYC